MRFDNFARLHDCLVTKRENGGINQRKILYLYLLPSGIAAGLGGSAMQRSMGVPIETVNMITNPIMLLMSVKLLRIILQKSDFRRRETHSIAQKDEIKVP